LSNAGHKNDGNGNRVGIPFRLVAVANAFCLMYTWTPDIGPFHYTTGIVLPIVHLDLRMAGMHGSDFNAGNIDIYGEKVSPDGNRGRTVGLGPMIRYDIDHGGFALKWQREFEVRNRPVSNVFWFQFSLPLTISGR
jgi:hypothetical protein